MITGLLADVAPVLIRFAAIFIGLWIIRKLLKHFIPWLKLIGNSKPWK